MELEVFKKWVQSAGHYYSQSSADSLTVNQNDILSNLNVKTILWDWARTLPTFDME